MGFLQRLGSADDVDVAPSFSAVRKSFSGPRAHEDFDALFEARLCRVAIEADKSRSAISYDWPAHVVTNWFIKRGKSHRGQEVRYFLVKFIGEKEDIKPDPEEIRYVKWVEYKELESHFVILNQWKTAKKIIKEFSL